MKLIEIIRAKPALENLTKKRFTNFAVARKLATLRKQVEEECEFFAQEQMKSVYAHAEMKDGKPVFVDGQHIKTKDPAAKIAFEQELTALNNTEISSVAPVELTETDFADPGNLPTPDEIFLLGGLVDFVEG